MRLEGAATFLALPRLTRVLASIPPRTSVTISIAVNYLDHAAHQAITDWERQHRATGGTVRIHGAEEAGEQTRRAARHQIEPEWPEAAA